VLYTTNLFGVLPLAARLGEAFTSRIALSF
jgi:hypothetical protein